MTQIYWYMEGVVNATIAFWGLIGIETLAVVGLVYLYFKSRGVFKFLLTVFILVNVVGAIAYLSTIGGYREFREQYRFYGERPSDVAGNLELYLSSPVKLDDLQKHVIEGGVDSVDVLIQCITESKNARCIRLLDETVLYSATRVTDTAPVGYVIPVKHQEVRAYLTNAYEIGTPAEQFYAARLLRKNYETDITFARLQELRTLVPNDVPLPMQ